jgi:glycosyltransferase involved in cell wall biosynthesis
MSSHAENAGGPSFRFVPLVARILYRFADGIVCVSEGVAKDLAAVTGLSQSRFQIVPNPIVSDRIPELAAAPIPDALNGQSFILGVGRLTALKDFSTLIEAFAELRKEKKMRLVILGEGEQRAQLEDLARAKGIADEVLLPGTVKNPFSWMSRAAMLVLPSQYEGFGNVLVEAMACGTQVVSTDCPTGPSEILAGGAFGRLVPVGDVRALADAMRATLVEPVCTREQLLAHAQGYSASRVADRYLKILGAD